MLTGLDYFVIAAYLVGVVGFGIWIGKGQKSTKDYFLGGRDLPWWAVCFSVVATETSTLTVISIPGVAYLGGMTFLQLTFGYLIGRIIVSIYFLPRYYRGDLTTAYAFLGERYGQGMRTVTSITFLITRLLADGVRLFATAIPIKVITDMAGLELSYFAIIAGLGVLTIAYTLVGGIKAVVWMDVIQMSVYVGGALLAVFVLLGTVGGEWWTLALEAGKFQVINLAVADGFAAMVTNPYAFITAVVGGALFSMASHGTDQLIVQRLLTCRSKEDSQKALIGSGIIVIFQFTLFLFVGALLWMNYQGAALADLGLSRPDELMPRFIIEGLPAGISGLVLAGIIAAAMSTLSSSLNSLASSSMFDLYERLSGRELSPKRGLQVSRILTFIWGFVFIGFASLFQDTTNPVVELGLAIAGYTYGGLLGAFLLGMLVSRTDQTDAIITFLFTIAFMVIFIFGVWHSPTEGWTFILAPGAETRAELGLRAVAWPWYPAIGVAVSLALGSLLSLRHRTGLTH
jgi:solute:Na+ symporter, SSS family